MNKRIRQGRGQTAAVALALFTALGAPARAEWGCPPPNSFMEFLQKFVKSSDAQRAHTQFPLEKLQLVAAEPFPRPVVDLLKESQLSFPLIPYEGEIFNSPNVFKDEYSNARISGDTWILVDRCERNRVEASLHKMGSFEAPAFIFAHTPQNQSWKLVRIENWAWPAAMQSSWLMNLFPRMKACFPFDSLFYDSEAGHSKTFYSDRILEKRGYRNPNLSGAGPKLTDELATYEIKEKIFGFDATELAIGIDRGFLIRITVQADAESVVRKIEEVTGTKVHLLPNDPAPGIHEIYVYRKDMHTSYIDCQTEDRN